MYLAFVIQLYFLSAHFMKTFSICINSFHKEFEIGCETEQKSHRFKTNAKMLYFHLTV